MAPKRESAWSSADVQRGTHLQHVCPSFADGNTSLSRLFLSQSLRYPLCAVGSLPPLSLPSPSCVTQWELLIFSATTPPATQPCPLHPSLPLPGVPLIHGSPVPVLDDFSSHWRTCPTPRPLGSLTPLFPRTFSPVPSQLPSPIS